MLDPATRGKLDEFLNRDPHPTGAGVAIMHIKQPGFPQFRFEWHPQKRKVYLIRIGTMRGSLVIAREGPVIAEILAEHAETHGDAYNFVQTWLRGFREGQTPDISKPHLEG